MYIFILEITKSSLNFDSKATHPSLVAIGIVMVNYLQLLKKNAHKSPYSILRHGSFLGSILR